MLCASHSPTRASCCYLAFFRRAKGEHTRSWGPSHCFDCEVLVALLLLGFSPFASCPAADGQRSAKTKRAAQLAEIRLADVSGAAHAPFEDDATKALALIFVSADCPIANSFQPTLQEVGRLTMAKAAPEVIEIDRQGTIRYRGLINDLHVGYGMERQTATQHDMRDAIESLLKDTPIALPQTKPPGCFIRYESTTQKADLKLNHGELSARYSSFCSARWLTDRRQATILLRLRAR
jgi:hypothetical protein